MWLLLIQEKEDKCLLLSFTYPFFLSNKLVSSISQGDRELLTFFFPLQVFFVFWIVMDLCIVIYLSHFNPFWSLYFLMLSCPTCGHGGPLPVSCVSLDQSQDGPSSRGRPAPAAQAPKKDQCKSGLWSRGGEHACEKLISRQSPMLLHELVWGSCNVLSSGGNNACSQPLNISPLPFQPAVTAPVLFSWLLQAFWLRGLHGFPTRILRPASHPRHLPQVSQLHALRF